MSNKPPSPEAEEAVRFLQTLFEPDDPILFRPIETWTEGGQKKSRVFYKGIEHRNFGIKDADGIWQPLKQRAISTVERQLRISKVEHTNVFFGVCPRFRSNQGYDFAWQIRKINCLWSDVDHCTVDDALKKIEAAGLPRPSVIVSSGNGAHFYWLLEHPYLIDDVGEPPVVVTEFPKEKPADGKRVRPRKYYVNAAGEEIDLVHSGMAPPLSPKARRAQDVLQGLASKIDGDQTHDLARILRLPGTINRKDERNNPERTPPPCMLVECEPALRYSFEQFEHLAGESPDANRREQLARVPLPTPRKLSKVSLGQRDKLHDAIFKCEVTAKGQRSHADFAVCCLAIELGIASSEFWPQVQHVGKFAEAGERYFLETWAKAETKVRSSILDPMTGTDDGRGRSRRQSSPLRLHNPDAPAPSQSNGHAGPEADDYQGADNSVHIPTIHISPADQPVRDVMARISDHMLRARVFYRRADQPVLIHAEGITAVLTAAQLAGVLNPFVEFLFCSKGGVNYKPLPPAYGSTWLAQQEQLARLPEIELFTRNPVFNKSWELVSPGYDPKSKIYYAGPLITPRSDTAHLDKLLSGFCWKAPGDRTNYLGMLLTTVLVSQFIGSKPCALFNGNQPSLGKSILAQIIGIIRDGRPVETVSYIDNDEEFEKRIGARVKSGINTVIIDNAKAKGRHSASIDSACLERSITDPILSFRLLGYSADIRCENSIIFCITANTPNVSRDLVTRCVVINLFHEGDPTQRMFSVADPEGYAVEHRLAILGELVGMVERWKAAGSHRAKLTSRFNKLGWADIIGGILQLAGESDFLDNAAEAAAEMDSTKREFSELIELLANHQQGVWTSSELVAVCDEHLLLLNDLGNGSARSRFTRMGHVIGRFVDSEFPVRVGTEQAVAVLRKEQNSRKDGHVYSVALRLESITLRNGSEP